MGIEFQTDMTQRTLASINGTEKNAYEEVQEKQALYEAAKNNYSIFLNKKNKIESQLKSSRYSDNSSLKSQYRALMSSVSDAEINVDVLRGSLLNSLSYYSKTNTSAFLANSILS